MSIDVTEDPLSEARAEFQTWRSRSNGRGRLPDHLWQRAIALLDRYPAALVCRELGLNSARLKARSIAGATSAPGHRRGKRARSGFAEIRGAELQARLVQSPSLIQSPSASVAGARVVLERPDGLRLSVELAPDACARLEALCSALLRARGR